MSIEILVLVSLLMLMILLGVQLIVAFGITAAIMFYMLETPQQLLNFGLTPYDAILSLSLIAIPMYILTGDLIVESGVAEKLFDLARETLGWLPGGLGVSAQAACGLFAGISGSNTASAAAIGRISTGELMKSGYDKANAGGIVASASITGILIPPSISYIILANVMRVSVVSLFIATIVPGILMISSLILAQVVISRIRGVNQETSTPNGKRILSASWRAKFGVGIPIIILGGIYSGIFTATEAAVVAITVILLHGIITRQLSFDQYYETVRRSCALNGMIVPLIAIFVIFSQVLSLYQIPGMLSEAILTYSFGYDALVIGIIFVILLIAGAFISSAPNILLFGPLLIPIGTSLGYDVYHFSIVFLSILALGFITPPVGINLFVLSGVINEPVENLAYESFPYFVVGVIVSIILLLFPSISLMLL